MSDYRSLMGAFIEEYENIYSEPVYKKLLSEEGRNSLTLMPYIEAESKYHTCPILFIEFEEGEEITELPCSHRFNSSAIDKWLTEEKAECPVCRMGLKHTTSEVPPPQHQIENIPIMPDIDAALALIDSINRAANMNRRYEYRTARVMSEDDDELREAIIASLNDLNQNTPFS
jgi:hypothetical protein|tara:strand:- start:1736 stop:2254 length:519 start_codon:yes stop_codon:yes gene_type:complete